MGRLNLFPHREGIQTLQGGSGTVHKSSTDIPMRLLRKCRLSSCVGSFPRVEVASFTCLPSSAWFPFPAIKSHRLANDTSICFRVLFLCGFVPFAAFVK